MKASNHSSLDDHWVDNMAVVDHICVVMGQDYCVYGYKMRTDGNTSWLSLDEFNRCILTRNLQKSNWQTEVISMMRWLDLKGLKGAIIQNENGSKLAAHKVRQALLELEAKQEFTIVTTREKISHIESFHFIEGKHLIDRHSFESFFNAKQHITRYMYW
jgi:hypothetical protein